jgi:hypothetical protein
LAVSARTWLMNSMGLGLAKGCSVPLRRPRRCGRGC